MSATAPRIEISPQSALADEPVQVRLGGLPPGAIITARARMAAWPGQRWGSQAAFVAGEAGEVDLTAGRPTLPPSALSARGARADDDAGRADAWRQTLVFLAEHPG